MSSTQAQFFLLRIFQTGLNKMKNSEFSIDINKGMLMGQGINLKKGNQDLENVYIPWSMLNSHFMCYGTTRMGKTRLLAFMARQIIEKGDHLVLVEPKGSEEQEVVSWIVQYANEFRRLNDIHYWSPEHPDISVKMNMLYGQNDEEATATTVGAMKVEDEFYEDIANEILMAIFPAFSFLEKLEDPLVVEMVKKMQYAKALMEEPMDIINKKILGDDFSKSRDGVTVDILSEYLEQAIHSDEQRSKITSAYKKALAYHNGTSTMPLRSFITFEDLAQYTSQTKIAELFDYVKETLATYEKNIHVNSDVVKHGKRALRELEKLKNRDAGYFSKVSTSYAVTMTRLSTGNVGKLLCESKINIYKDEFYKKDSSSILIMQPFPMKYGKAADMSVKMLMAMLNSIMANVGVSGVANEKRVHVMVDESGSIVNRQQLSLANKGGGLGLSLYLFSQSFADYIDALGEDGATIINDNANSKAFFLVNDDKSAETISRIIGSAKRGDITYGNNEGTISRTQGRAVEELLIPPHTIMQMQPMTYAMKVGSEVYMMAAPFQRDPFLDISFPHANSVNEVEAMNAFMEEKRKNEDYNDKGYIR